MHWGTPILATEIPFGANEVEAEADDDEDYEPSRVEPSWAKKLKHKMKKLFCMESRGQDMAHVFEKKSHSCHKILMCQLGAEIASRSEDKITDKEEWVSRHCPWTDSDTEQPSADDGGAGDHAGM